MAQSEVIDGKARPKDSLVVNIVGGLGNQLFQYLFGRSLENVSKLNVVFDTSDFWHYRLHKGLAIERYFEIKLPLISKEQLEQVPWLCRSRFGKRVASRFISRKGSSLKIQTDYSFDLRKQPISPYLGEYFLGYWQSQRYFSDEINVVKNSLCFREEIELAAEQAVDLVNITFDRAAAVHVRRGDYVTAPSRAPQYALPLEYYLQGMDMLASERGVSKFYIFSDDIEWAKLNFPAYYELCFIESSVSNSAGIDMCLLSKFSEMVISNSSFGWWAAALRKNGNGLVLYPQQWVKKRFLDDETKIAKTIDGWQALNWNVT